MEQAMKGDAGIRKRVLLHEVTVPGRVPGECPCTMREIEFEGGVPRETVNMGEYWELGHEGSLQLVSDDGTLIGGDAPLDSLELPVDVRRACLASLERPGDWAEREFRSGPKEEGPRKLRITWLAEPPKVSAERTLRASELSDAEKSRIRVYGKPLLEEGSLVGDNLVWKPDLLAAVSDAVMARLKAIAPEVTRARLLLSGSDGRKAAFRLDVRAESRDALVKALEAAGVKGADALKLDVMRGRADGSTEAAAQVTFTDSLG